MEQRERFIRELAVRSGLSVEEARTFYDAFIDLAFEQLNHSSKLELPDLGKFTPDDKTAKELRNAIAEMLDTMEDAEAKDEDEA